MIDEGKRRGDKGQLAIIRRLLLTSCYYFLEDQYDECLRDHLYDHIRLHLILLILPITTGDVSQNVTIAKRGIGVLLMNAWVSQLSVMCKN